MLIISHLDKQERIVQLSLSPSLYAGALIQMHSVLKENVIQLIKTAIAKFSHVQENVLVLHSFKRKENQSSISVVPNYFFSLKLFTALLYCVIRPMCAWQHLNCALFGTETVPWTQIHALLFFSFFPFYFCRDFINLKSKAGSRVSARLWIPTHEHHACRYWMTQDLEHWTLSDENVYLKW